MNFLTDYDINKYIYPLKELSEELRNCFVFRSTIMISTAPQNPRWRNSVGNSRELADFLSFLKDMCYYNL